MQYAGEREGSLVKPRVLAGMGPLLVATDGEDTIALALARAHQLTGLVREAVGAEDAWPIEIVLGDDVTSLAQLAREREASLIVTGRVPHGFLERVVHGETLLELVRASRVPVLAVPATMSRLPRIAVVAVGEGTAGASAAGVVSLLLANAVEIHLVHVRAQPQALYERERREEDDEIEAAIQRAFDVVQRAWKLPADVAVTSHELIGRPVPELLRFAENVGADLLVTGLATTSHGLPHRELAERLLHQSPLAMLLVPVECGASASGIA